MLSFLIGVGILLEFDTSRMVSLNESHWKLGKRRMEDLYCNEMHAPILGESNKPENYERRKLGLIE